MIEYFQYLLTRASTHMISVPIASFLASALYQIWSLALFYAAFHKTY